ncbi:Dedicator of cytokinesis protein 4 [Frankliniella fusca]|uniref:Dedicator of cytokinesis protein 4 n=1 Tax=Frankliniella fusca TaxID=407009 RepID=A0AAE1L6Z8_9NEOP|nr:Dedicator of cytokinesis protein 4 [Frankliniella fusca]
MESIQKCFTCTVLVAMQKVYCILHQKRGSCLSPSKRTCNVLRN